MAFAASIFTQLTTIWYFFGHLLYPIGSKHLTKNVESTGKVLFALLSKLWLSTNVHETPNYTTVLRGAPVSDFTQIGQDI